MTHSISIPYQQYHKNYHLRLINVLPNKNIGFVRTRIFKPNVSDLNPRQCKKHEFVARAIYNLRINTPKMACTV